MNPYPHLFEPIKIGKTTVKNRIFMPPHLHQPLQ